MSDKIKNIFHSFYAPLCNYANVLVNDKHLAEDLVQNVFVQLWEKDKLTTLDHPESFLIRCVKNKCIDYHRSNKHRNEVLMNDLPETGLPPSHSLKEEDIDPLLSYLIAKLPPKMKQVFLLSREKKLTYKQIADELNISIKTVENQMGTALKKMRILLKDLHYLPFLLLIFQ